MKKITFIAAICAALAACNKVEEVNFSNGNCDLTILTAAVDIAQTKVAPNAGDGEGELEYGSGTLNFHWEEGDVVTITSESEKKVLGTYELDNSSISGKVNPTTATFKGPGAPAEGDKVEYTGSLYNDASNNICLKYAEGSFRPVADGKVGKDGTSFTLNEFYPVLKLQLRGLAKIGKLEYAINDACELTMNFDSPLQLTSSAAIIYFPLNKTSSSDNVASIRFYDENGILILAKTTKKAFEKNHIYTMPELAVNPAILPGKFSVNSSLDQVQFTKGNLYWDGSAYHLEASQTAYPASWDTGHVGHFFWTFQINQPYAETYASSHLIDFFCSKDNKMTVDGQEGLYAMSSDEWTYLIDTREVNGGTGEGKSYQRATVNYVYGLILYPDGYRDQDTATSYTSDQWATMEAAGCVFLPAAGYRDAATVSDAGSSGHYWSSTLAVDQTLLVSEPCRLSFRPASLYTAAHCEKDKGIPVRLVCAVSNSIQKK